MKKKRKLFDKDTRINRPIILGYGEAEISKKEIIEHIPVLARKQTLQKSKEGKELLKYVEWEKSVNFSPPKPRTIKVGNKKVKLKDEYLPIGNIDIIRPKSKKLMAKYAQAYKIKTDKNTKILHVNWFYPKGSIEGRELNIKRKGIGTAALRRVKELAKAITKESGKTYVVFGTYDLHAQQTFEKLGFKEINNLVPAAGKPRDYVFKIEKKAKK